MQVFSHIFCIWSCYECGYFAIKVCDCRLLQCTIQPSLPYANMPNRTFCVVCAEDDGDFFCTNITNQTIQTCLSHDFFPFW